MKKKIQSDTTPSERRKALERDVSDFLKAGNEIQYIDDGVSAQDPQGKGRPLRLNQPKEAPAAADSTKDKPEPASE